MNFSVSKANVVILLISTISLVFGSILLTPEEGLSGQRSSRTMSERLQLHNRKFSCASKVPRIESETDLLPKVHIHRVSLSKSLSKSKKFFISYADDVYEDALVRITNQAKKSGFFDDVRDFRPQDLSSSFRRMYIDVFSRRRGGGYWIWKHEIIRRTLDRMDWGDFLVYQDAGTTVNGEGLARFDEYMKIANVSESGMLAWSWPGPESNWTTDKLFRAIGVYERKHFWHSTHVIATVFVFQKRQAVMEMIRMYSSLIRSDQLLITDDYSNLTRRASFFEHRHDQSIFSLLLKCYGVVLFPYERINFGFDVREPFQKSHRTNKRLMLNLMFKNGGSTCTANSISMIVVLWR